MVARKGAQKGGLAILGRQFLGTSPSSCSLPRTAESAILFGELPTRNCRPQELPTELPTPFLCTYTRNSEQLCTVTEYKVGLGLGIHHPCVCTLGWVGWDPTVPTPPKICGQNPTTLSDPRGPRLCALHMSARKCGQKGSEGTVAKQ